MKVCFHKRIVPVNIRLEVSRVKAKSRADTAQDVLTRIDDLGIVLTDFERQNISILIECVKAGNYWHKHRDDKKAERRMQEARDRAGEVYPDLPQRARLFSAIDDVLG